MSRVAPPYLLAYTSVIFGFALLFPPAIYSEYISERNLMFLNPSLIVFYLVCSVFFLSGYFLFFSLSAYFLGEAIPKKELFDWSFSSLYLLIAAVLFNIFSIYDIVNKNENLITILLAQEGYLIKDDVSDSNAGGLYNFICIGIFWYYYFKYFKHETALKKFQFRVFIWSLVILFFTIVLSSLAKLSRGELIPFLIGAVVIYIDARATRKNFSKFQFYLFLAKFLLVVFSIFSAFSLFRGSIDFDKILADFFGYTLASYNRLAALLEGELNYTYHGTGVYLSSFLSFNKTLNSLFGVAAYFGWPTYSETWWSEFVSVGMYGFNKYLIWPSALGYLFLDFGWVAPLVLFFYGIFYGLIWRLWLKESVFGLLLYPWFGFCLVFWFGTNYLLDTKLFVLLGTAGVIHIGTRFSRYPIIRS